MKRLLILIVQVLTGCGDSEPEQAATNFIEEHSAETLRNSVGAIIGLQLANKGLTDNDLKGLQSFNRLQNLFLDDNPITDICLYHI